MTNAERIAYPPGTAEFANKCNWDARILAARVALCEMEPAGYWIMTSVKKHLQGFRNESRGTVKAWWGSGEEPIPSPEKV